ncbi:MAG: aminoacyl-tRNA hydrolase, partial [bacterium]
VKSGPNYREATGETRFGELVLLKPMTYMNRSGNALRAWAARTGNRLAGDQESELPAPIVVCDDLALPLGSLRVRAHGGAGGQKGLAHIIQVLGGEYIPRVRLGIAGGDGQIPAEEWSDYVLEPFLADEEIIVQELVALASDALEYLLEHDPIQTASRFNRRLRPQVD